MDGGLEVTVRIRLKGRGRMLKFKLENTRELLTPGNINRQELIQKPPYLHLNQAPPKSQSKIYHTNSPATQEHSPAGTEH